LESIFHHSFKSMNWDSSEICAQILLDMKHSGSRSKMKRKPKMKKILKLPISNHVIQIFECRMCHQTFTSEHAILEHEKVCRDTLAHLKICQQDSSKHKSYLKISLKCVC